MKGSTALQAAAGMGPLQEEERKSQETAEQKYQLPSVIAFLIWDRSSYGKVLMHMHLPQLPRLLSAFPKLEKLHSRRCVKEEEWLISLWP